MNPLRRLRAAGQSVWLDLLRRGLVTGGELERLIDEGGLPDLDLHRIADLWRHGSVVRSWLLDLAERALARDPSLEGVGDHVEDSGEGRWTLIEAIEEGVPAPVTALSLFARFASRQQGSFSMKVIAALRREFGGHAVRES